MALFNQWPNEDEERNIFWGAFLGRRDVIPKRSKLDQYLTNDDFKTDLNRLVFDVATEDLSTDLEIVIADGL